MSEINLLNLIRRSYLNYMTFMLIIVAFAAIVFTPALVYAEPEGEGSSGSTVQFNSDKVQSVTGVAPRCTNGENCNFVTNFINPVIKILSGMVSLVIVTMVIIGGIQYGASGRDPQKVVAAKGKITNALFALLIYIFLLAILNWLVPGGVV